MTRDDVSGIFIRLVFFSSKIRHDEFIYMIKDINKRSNEIALQGNKGKLGRNKTEEERERENDRHKSLLDFT